MARVETAVPDEPLDVFVRRTCGTERKGNVEAVLDANPGLALVGPILPAGLRIRIPDALPSTAAPAPARPKTSLW